LDEEAPDGKPERARRAGPLSVQAVCETGDIVVEPYQDPSNSVENRVEDLLARLTVEDKAGLMFHDIVAMGPGGQLMGANNSFGRPATDEAIQKKRLNHFNLAGQVNNVRDLVAWHNRVQELALARARSPSGHSHSASRP
jgi:hypothetical protein